MKDFKIIKSIDKKYFDFFSDYNFVFLQYENVPSNIILLNYYSYLSKYEKDLAVIKTNSGCYLISKSILRILDSGHFNKQEGDIVSSLYHCSINLGIISIENEVINYRI